MFIICFVELDSVGVLWKQTQMVKKNKKAEKLLNRAQKMRSHASEDEKQSHLRRGLAL